MKKLCFCLVLLGTCLLAGCDGQNGTGSTEREIKVNVYKCPKANITTVEECKSEFKNPAHQTIQVSNEEFKNISNNWEGLSDNMKKIFLEKDDKINSEISHFDGNTISIPTSNNCKTYNVSFDLTYYDWEAGKENIVNQYAIEERLQTLKSFLDGDNQKSERITFGDKVVLRFLGGLQGNNKKIALNDKITLFYGEPCGSNTSQYEILSSLVEKNNMLGEINFFYILSDKITGTGDTIQVSKDIDTLIGQIKKEVATRYGENSEGTFLLSHLSNIANENITDKDIFIILTDFFFQLESEDAKKLRKKYCSMNGNYCNDSIYNFSEENVSTRYMDGWFFKALFTKHVFKDLSLDLSPICKNKNSIYLLGISSIPGLSLQNNIKDYYSNYLFPNCEVFYK